MPVDSHVKILPNRRHRFAGVRKKSSWLSQESTPSKFQPTFKIWNYAICALIENSVVLLFAHAHEHSDKCKWIHFQVTRNTNTELNFAAVSDIHRLKITRVSCRYTTTNLIASSSFMGQTQWRTQPQRSPSCWRTLANLWSSQAHRWDPRQTCGPHRLTG